MVALPTTLPGCLTSASLKPQVVGDTTSYRYIPCGFKPWPPLPRSSSPTHRQPPRPPSSSPRHRAISCARMAIQSQPPYLTLFAPTSAHPPPYCASRLRLTFTPATAVHTLLPPSPPFPRRPVLRHAPLPRLRAGPAAGPAPAAGGGDLRPTLARQHRQYTPRAGCVGLPCSRERLLGGN